MANSSIDFFKSQSKLLFKDYKTRYYNEERKEYAYQPKYYDVAAVFRSFEYPDQDPDFTFTLMNAQHLMSWMAGFEGWEKLIHVSEEERDHAKPLLDKFRIGQSIQEVSEEKSNRDIPKILGGERAKNIITFAILTAVDPNEEKVVFTYRRVAKITYSLTKILPKLSFPIKGHNGNEESCFLIMNKPLISVIENAGRCDLASFFFCRGGVLEYWEKKDLSKKHDSVVNEYIKKDVYTDCAVIVDEEHFSLTGKNFQFTIPFSIFDTLSDKLQKNIDLYFNGEDKIVYNCMYESGFEGYRRSKKLYEGIVPYKYVFSM
ncbi:MAG: hypothetical protein IK017_05450 [Paludibacteraceae bacterium]|nr:hypothetical protein [Paludibacteraceae bacterium]MBR5972083.1 hypothetical protein [Paludibacteraceae bacterium]